MGRPRGSPNRLQPGDVGYKKPGRKLGSGKIRDVFTDVQILEYKVQLLELMSSGNAETLADAARQLGIDPVKVHHWSASDKDFQEMVRLCREVVADDLEKELRHHGNFIPKLFLLKGYRPMFRDNYRVVFRSERLEELLNELKKAKGETG